MSDDFTHYHDTEHELPIDLSNNIISLLGRVCCLSLVMVIKTQEGMNDWKDWMVSKVRAREVSTEQLSALRIAAFGSTSYVAKSPDEHRRLFIAGLRHCLNMLEKE